MRVVEDELIGILSEAGNLLRARLVKTLLVETNIQTSRQQRGAGFQLLGIAARFFANCGQIFFEPQPVEARLFQILRGSHKRSGLASDSSAQGVESASRLRSQEDQSLFSFFGNGDENTFIAGGLIPGFDASKPGIRRRISGPAQKRDDHKIMHRLSVRQVRMHPKAVSSLEMRNLGDG